MSDLGRRLFPFLRESEQAREARACRLWRALLDRYEAEFSAEAAPEGGAAQYGLLPGEVLDLLQKGFCLLLEDPFGQEAILANGQIISAIQTRKTLLSRIVGDDDTLTGIARDGVVVAMMAANTELLSAISRHPQYQKLVFDDPCLMARIFSPQALSGIVLRDRNTLRTLLRTPLVLKAILEDEAVLGKILQHTRVLNRVVRHPVVRWPAPSPQLLPAMLENDREGLQSFLSSPELYGNKDTCPWVMNAAAFREFWGKLFRVLALHRVPLAAKREAMFRAAQGDPLPDVFFDMLGVDDCLPLRDGVLYVPDRHSAWILLNEILADQDYAFPTSCRNPRIIDCGAHCGVAVYFFKSRYPDAVITCFEPLESLRSLLHKNILANEYENVDVQPYALAGGEGKAKFYTVQRDSMAGSLGTRRQEYEDDLIETEVTTVRLSDYLNEPVQMLKLDVEGAELEVLCECRHKLGMVENIFVEYHEDGANKYDGKLPRVLSILDEAGFMCRVDTPRGGTSRQGVACVGKPYSISIWGRRVPGAQE